MRKKNDVLKKRNLLVCVDDSEEFMEAVNFACNNAEKDKMGLILLHVIEEENFRHWKGVENIMKQEQKDKAKEVLNKYINYVKENFKLEVKSHIKSGEKLEVLLDVIGNKKFSVKYLILGLAMDKAENNRIISSLTGSMRKKLTLPIIIVPGKV